MRIARGVVVGLTVMLVVGAWRLYSGHEFIGAAAPAVIAGLILGGGTAFARVR